jgi:hypothetical protein
LQRFLALGIGMPGRLTGQRLLLLALVAGGCALQLRSPEPHVDTVSSEVGRLLQSAGYRVQETHQSWLGGQITGSLSIVAQHPTCREPVVVKVVPLEWVPPVSEVGPYFYVYDTWQGALPSRLTVLSVAAKLELISLARVGRPGKASRLMLAIRDPSACLSLATIPWHVVWRKASDT